MTIDISKIKPGDKVTLVPLEVAAVNSLRNEISTYAGGKYRFFPLDQIAVHHPAPREFQVGDRVRHAVEETAFLGTVRGVDGARLWVRWDNSPINWNADADDLTLVEGGE